MRMIAGLETPSEGEIWIGDRLVNDDLPKDRDVAMVFQNYGLYPHMTILRISPTRSRCAGRPKRRSALWSRRRRRASSLAPFLQRKPKSLSGGQRQRIALARAIVRTPKVFLMDEPLSNVDAKLRVTMRAELKHLSRQLKITTIYVTHDQIEAMTLADRVAVMSDGVIQQLGSPDEIYNRPANLFVAGFIGAPAMNLIKGSIRAGRFYTAGGTALVAVQHEDAAQIVLGVRADDMQVAEPGAGDIDVPIYAFENTGEATFLTVEWEQQRVIARGDRHLRKEQDEVISLTLNPEHIHLFDPQSGNRISD